MKAAVLNTSALAPGSVIKHFEVTECLGMDLHCGLYRAASLETETPVLLMEYLPAGLCERYDEGVRAVPGASERYKNAISRYARQLREVAQIGHPALPLMDDIWQEQGALYAVGPWRDGRGLLADGVARKPLPDEQILQRWARSMGDALSALHRQKLLHGNLALHMFQLCQTGELILPPAGGDVFGNDLPPWLAPEQHPLNDRPSPVGPWSDVYQLSAVMYQLITGAAPPTILRRWEGAPLKLVPNNLPQAQQRLTEATRKGLSMHPDARPQSVQAWLDLAGLPDRRTRSRYEFDSANVTTKVRPAGTRFSIPAAASGAAAAGFGDAASPRPAETSSFDDVEMLDDLPDETPIWVWLCLGVAVVAFITILVRTL